MLKIGSAAEITDKWVFMACAEVLPARTRSGRTAKTQPPYFAFITPFLAEYRICCLCGVSLAKQSTGRQPPCPLLGRSQGSGSCSASSSVHCCTRLAHPTSIWHATTASPCLSLVAVSPTLGTACVLSLYDIRGRKKFMAYTHFFLVNPWCI